jgi:hypothetical protein
MGKTLRVGLYLVVVLVVGGVLATALPSAAYVQLGRRCFAETPYCIEGRIREFWEQNGGLSVFGFPIRAQHEQSVEGRDLQVQWFQRHRIELHPNNPYPYDIQLGRLGDARLQQRGDKWWSVFSTEAPSGGCRFFSETGHNICGRFWTAWRTNGLERDGNPYSKTEAENLALFGLPLSGEHTETYREGTFTVQWFERARFEYHPELANTPYVVLFGLLSNEIARAAGNPANIPTFFPIPPGVIRPGETPCPRTPPPGVPPEVFLLDQPKEIATRFAICLRGFAPDQSVSAQVTRPDTVVDATEVVSTTNRGIAGLLYESLPGDLLGVYTISATQGALQATTTFTVTAPTQPRILVTPPSGPPGTIFQVVLAGFEPVQLVPLHLYYNTSYIPPADPLQQPIVQVDYQGTGVFLLETQGFAPGLYIVDPGTFQEVARRGEPRMFTIRAP